MVEPIFLVHVAGQGVPAPLRRPQHPLLLGWRQLLAVLPEISSLASFPRGYCSHFF